MKKRVNGLLLSLLLLLSLIASAVLPAFAASDMTASEDCVAVLKKMEGFSKYPMDDYGQYSVGYGTACPEDDLARYRSQGITEEEADELLRSTLSTMGTSINKFAASNNLTLRQNQFDALLLLTYNIGTSWISGSSDLKDAILTGATGNDLIYYMSRWCTADYQILIGLVERRLAEADLFLNGNYSAEMPSYYSYVIFDANGGVCTSRVQGYDASDPAAVKATPTRSGYRFLGWYTDPEGGSWITDLDTTTAELTLYAHWQLEDGNVENGMIQGTACSYKRKVNSASTLSVYAAPNAATPFAQLNAGITVKIVADYVDSAGAKWGKMEGGGWINLGTTHQTVYPAAKTVTTNVNVTVTSSFINVRSGAGTAYSAVGKVHQGDTLVISETQMVGSVKWGRYSGGWICLSYTDYDASGETVSGTGSSADLTGTVTNCTSLRVRSGPGTSYVSVGELQAGDAVTITQTKTVGAAVWGRIESGWICLSYVKLNETVTSAPDTSEEEGEGRQGTVINCTSLNVRSGAGTANKLVDSLPAGTRVTIYETTTVRGIQWGRIRQGWVSMAYIQLDYSGTSEGQTGTVVSDIPLNVRSGAGTSCSKVTTLNNGATVTVYETTTVNGVVWGRISQGWVCMTYVKLGTDSTGPETTGGTITGTVTGTDSLRIRKGAGTGYAKVGTLSRGTQVEIYETTTASNGTKWGRISQGWVCMRYIQTDGEALFTGTVNTESLRIRSAAGTTNSVVGSYNYGTEVEILETAKLGTTTWGRTNQGWISLSYVKY